MMNPNTFSILGYLSVLLWIAVPLLWMLRRRVSFPGWLPLALALLSFAFATLNSRLHVSRIDVEVPDPAANALDIAAAKRKTLEEARGKEVADIRFAEDGAEDFIDKAGMDESEKKYLDHISGNQEPAWKQQKKQRGDDAKDSNELDDLIDTEKPADQLSNTALPEEKQSRAPILMPEPQVTTARKLNKFNLNATLIALLLGVSYLLVDYLTRANSYASASCALPFPASWRNAFTPLSAVVSPRESMRRDLPAELAWLVRQGDVFLCLSATAVTLPPTLPRLGKKLFPVDVIAIDSDLISDTFVIESLWYGRACFTAAGDRTASLFPALLAQLTLRHNARAKAKRNIHIVWNLTHPPGENDLATLERIARDVGVSLFVVKS